MKNINNKNHSHKLDQEIKAMLGDNLHDIHLNDELKQQIISMKENIKPLSPLQKFLNKEIRIPVSSVSVVVGVMILGVGMFFNTLLLPGDIPEPKYQIIEMQIVHAEDRVRE